MTSDELKNLLTIAGIPSRIVRDEVVVETCIFCGNAKWNLELNAEKGMFGCWACKSGGRLETLLFTLTGQTYRIPVSTAARERRRAVVASSDFLHVPAYAVPSAELYLGSRGIDYDTAEAYGLGVCIDDKHQLFGRIVIPVLDFWSQKPLGWIGRSYIRQNPKYLSTVPTAAVTGWRWASKKAPTVVVEGHLDGIAVHRAGCTAAVLGGVHAPDLVAWGARLPPGPVIVMLDGDAEEEANKILWTLSTVRTEGLSMRVMPKGTDPASQGPEWIRDIVHQHVVQLGVKA